MTTARRSLSAPIRSNWPAFRLLTAADKARLGALGASLLRTSNADIWNDTHDEPTEAYLRRFGFSAEGIEHFFRPFFAGILLNASLDTSSKDFRFIFKMLAAGQTITTRDGLGAIPQQIADGDPVPWRHDRMRRARREDRITARIPPTSRPSPSRGKMAGWNRSRVAPSSWQRRDRRRGGCSNRSTRRSPHASRRRGCRVRRWRGDCRARSIRTRRFSSMPMRWRASDTWRQVSTSSGRSPTSRTRTAPGMVIS